MCKSKYHRDIEFGPEFVCICCHGAFFEDQVFVLTDKREGKIDPELMKKSCDRDEIKNNCYDLFIIQLTVCEPQLLDQITGKKRDKFCLVALYSNKGC